MKRFWILLLVALMLLSLLVACDKDEPAVTTAATTEETIDRESLANEQLERDTYISDIVLAHYGLTEDQVNVHTIDHNLENMTSYMFFEYENSGYACTVNLETGEIISADAMG